MFMGNILQGKSVGVNMSVPFAGFTFTIVINYMCVCRNVGMSLAGWGNVLLAMLGSLFWSAGAAALEPLGNVDFRSIT